MCLHNLFTLKITNFTLIIAIDDIKEILNCENALQ